MYPLIHPEFQLLVISGDWMWRSNFYIFEIFISKQYELWMDGWEMRTIKFHFGCGDGDALQYRNSGRDEDNDPIFLGLQLIGMKNSFFSHGWWLALRLICFFFPSPFHLERQMNDDTYNDNDRGIFISVVLFWCCRLQT